MNVRVYVSMYLCMYVCMYMWCVGVMYVHVCAGGCVCVCVCLCLASYNFRNGALSSLHIKLVANNYQNETHGSRTVIIMLFSFISLFYW